MRNLEAEVWKVVGLIENGDLDKPPLLLKAIDLVVTIRKSETRDDGEPSRDPTLKTVMERINGAKS